MTDRYYCRCSGCVNQRGHKNIYIPCVSSKYSVSENIDTVNVSVDDMPRTRIEIFPITNTHNSLFDVMKNINELKHDDGDTSRTKAAFNNNLDKAISYIMKAINQ